ncbi:hypothetical protein V6N12_061026 [Hibiscus sabdariffa]|uniref:RNase H type-1 domain-containing protein n=1 Tax=Hibiscus sabdariffa TaxID=183260 RepID=A0ABR2DZ94_9ROSI
MCIAACVPPNPMHPDDKVGWSGESSGKFSVKSAYGLRMGLDWEAKLLPWKVIQQFKAYGVRSLVIKQPMLRQFMSMLISEWVVANLTPAPNTEKYRGSVIERSQRLVELTVAAQLHCSGVTHESRQVVLPARRWVPYVEGLDVYRALRDMKSRELRCSLVMHVSNLMARQWEVKVSHVICDGNFVADGLAELVTRNSRSVNVFKEPPPSIIRSLSGDASV